MVIDALSVFAQADYVYEILKIQLQPCFRTNAEPKKLCIFKSMHCMTDIAAQHRVFIKHVMLDPNR